MSIIKPYTFQGGEKARASEVNEDFDILYTEVNKNISAINNNTNSISNLELTKANVNGSTNNVFKVRDPVTSQDAVNKQTLFNKIGNSINLIGGLIISKDTGNNKILVKPGKCYDSTGEYVLSLNNIVYAENGGQSPGLRYDVYITSSNNGASSEISILGEGQTPNNVLYRKIGFYITNSGNSVVMPVSYGTDENCNELGKFEPDYASGVISVTVPANGSYKITTSGWVTAASAQPNMRINGSIPYILQTFIPAGTTLTSTTAYTFNFLPCKGY